MKKGKFEAKKGDNKELNKETGRTGGGVVEPPLGNLEGNPRRGVPMMGETEQEGVFVSTNNRKACLSLRTPMAYSASTATPALVPQPA